MPLQNLSIKPEWVILDKENNMTATTKYGNFNIESQNHKDWIIGHFMEENSPFKNNNFKIKWGKRKKG